MRVTMSMIYGSVVSRIQTTQASYAKAAEVALTTKRINRPSDDPVGSSRAIDLRSMLASLDQYDSNLDTAAGFTEQTELALANVEEAIQRAKEIAVDINGGTSSAGDYAAAAEELDAIIDEVINNMNAKYGDRYVFSGYRTTTVPFDATGNYSGGPVGQDIEIEATQGQYLTINLTGDEVFKTGVDVPQVLIDMRDAIAAGDQAAITDQLSDLTAALDQVLSFETAMGAVTDRIDIARENNEQLRLSATAILSDVEDADITEAATEFTKQETALEAVMTVSARILQQNFLDFLA